MERIIAKIISTLSIDKIDPKRKLLISVLTPFFIDIKKVPIASEDIETRAIIESPCILWFSFNLSIRKDTRITIGIVNKIGDALSIVATENAPKATWDNPSPIIEFFLNTREVPINDEQTDIKIPVTRALIINE